MMAANTLRCVARCRDKNKQMVKQIILHIHQLKVQDSEATKLIRYCIYLVFPLKPLLK